MQARFCARLSRRTFDNRDRKNSPDSAALPAKEQGNQKQNTIVYAEFDKSSAFSMISYIIIALIPTKCFSEICYDNTCKDELSERIIAEVR